MLFVSGALSLSPRQQLTGALVRVRRSVFLGIVYLHMEVRTKGGDKR